VVINADGEFEPYLAESIEPNDDLTEWTFTLRSGVEFHDGTPLDAEAIVWNYENLHQARVADRRCAQHRRPPVGRGRRRAHRRLHPQRPNAAFPDLLTGRVGMPASPTAFEEMGFDAFGAARSAPARSWCRTGHP
jgi:peptide/nickel transport system substrate-binding protein